MENTTNRNITFSGGLSVFSLLGVLVTFLCFVPAYSTNGRPTLAGWLMATWNSTTEFEHAWVVPFLFIAFMSFAWKKMKTERVEPMNWGLFVVIFGILMYVVSVRVIQPRVAMFGLPFLISGCFLFVYGWKVTRHTIFPSFFWYFAVPMPGIQQATNLLQLMVTNTCYQVGTFLGMKLVHTGNTIVSATDSWSSLDIAEGCSGIRSLLALVMISAIYSYYSQTKLWKMGLLFLCALPLAVLANFLRIFTIIVLAEMGYSDFAAGVYHDWAGLVFFFPITLAGLIVGDRLLNWRSDKKQVKVRTVH